MDFFFMYVAVKVSVDPHHLLFAFFILFIQLCKTVDFLLKNYQLEF